MHPLMISNRTRPIPSRRIGLLVFVLIVVGCTAEPPATRRVQYGPDLLDMQIAEAWQLERDSEAGRVYRHAKVGDVRLQIVAGTEEYGSPLKVAHVKSLIGKELNLEYGGVTTRVSFGGNAMIRYSREVIDEDDVAHFAQEWVIAKPVGYGDVARIEISLLVPPQDLNDPAIPALIEALDQQVGDATIPRA